MPGTVTVGCTLPHGLVLQLFQMEEEFEQLLTGGERKVMRARAETKPGFNMRVKIHGSARYLGKDSPHEIRNGAGLTFGVDAEFFAEWKKRNAGADYAKYVFAHVKMDELTAQAKDVRAIPTGFEPLNPSNLPAEFKGKIASAPIPAP